MGGGGYDDYGRGGNRRGQDSRSPPPRGNYDPPGGRGRDYMNPPPRGGYDNYDAPRGKGGGKGRQDSRSPPPRDGGRENERGSRGYGDGGSRYSPPPPARKGGQQRDGKGRGRDSRSPPPRDGGRENERGSRGGDGGSRYSPPPPSRKGGQQRDGKGRDGGDGGSRYSPPRNRGNDRGGDGARDWLGPPRSRKSRSRSRDRAAPKEKLTYDPEYRIPPPKRKAQTPVASTLELTPEMKKNSLEHEGFYYATMDFTAPQCSCGFSPVVPKPYDATKRTDPSWIPWNRLPAGWDLVPSEMDDSVKEKVIAAFDWGTHILVVSGGRAYVTQGGKARAKPGSLEMIWEMEKGPNGIKLQSRKASHSYWHGKLFIRAPIQ